MTPTTKLLKFIHSPRCIGFRTKAKLLCMAHEDPHEAQPVPVLVSVASGSFPPSSYTLRFSYVHYDCTLLTYMFVLALPSLLNAFLLLFSIVNS